MSVKKNSYIGIDLDFAEEQLAQWRQYMENNPIDQLQERWGKKEMPKGGQTWVVVATVEQQIKCIQDTLAKYLQMLEVINRLRAEEAKKIETRGNSSISLEAEAFLKKSINND